MPAAFAVTDPTAAELAEIEQRKAEIRAENERKDRESDEAWRKQHEAQLAQTQKGRDPINKLEKDTMLTALERRAQERQANAQSNGSPATTARRVCPKCGREITAVRNRCYFCDPGAKPGPRPQASAPAVTPRPVVSGGKCPKCGGLLKGPGGKRCFKCRPNFNPKGKSGAVPTPAPAPVRPSETPSFVREIEALQAVAVALEGLSPEAIQWVLAPFVRQYTT